MYEHKMRGSGWYRVILGGIKMEIKEKKGKSVTYDEYSAWDLFRRGQIDQRKHLKILEKMIKDNVKDLITHGKIIAGDNVVLPVKHLKQWRFRYAKKGEGTITLPGADKKKEGDIIAEKEKEGQGEGQGEGGNGGDNSGYYEVVVNADKIAEYLFQNMNLPRIRKKQSKKSFKEKYKMDSVSRKGSANNLHKRRTVYENLKRNAIRGETKFHKLVDDDLRYRSNSIKKVPQDKIVAFFVRDRSASMNDHKKEMTRIMSFWFNQFLEYKYSSVVEKVHVLFDTCGQRVSEEEFFSMSEGGGTNISSGVRIVQELMEEEYPTSVNNVYVFLFTDGDNFSNDNERVFEMVEGMMGEVNLFGVCHIKDYPGSYFYNSMDSEFIREARERAGRYEELEVVTSSTQEEIVEVMRKLFGGEER